MNLKVTILCNYADETEVEAAIPEALTANELGKAIVKLVETEPEMTSFVVTAARVAS
jgi:hypothetical protein